MSESSATGRSEVSQERIEELADYFDNTDLGEVPSEEVTDVEIERWELEQVSLRLPAQDVKELTRRAAKLGVGYTTLIRMILRDHLRSSLKR
jgi:predicted DNA binding CopG/RHH family protein